MSGFSTKANNTQTTQATGGEGGGNSGEGAQAQQEAYAAWYEYYDSLFGGTYKPATNKKGEVLENRFTKKATLVGVLKWIVDAGTQPQGDSSYTSKLKAPAAGSDVMTAEEEAHVAKFKDNYFFWLDGVRMQGKPERNTQEYILFYDFPKIMIDWKKHPNENMHHLGVKPLRVSYNGDFTPKGSSFTELGKRLRLNPNYKTGKLSDNNPFMKIASASRVAEEFSNSEYDLGVLVDTCCKWEVVRSRNNTENGRVYIKDTIKNQSEIVEVEAGDITITVAQQIPECSTEFVGTLMNGGDYPDSVLEMISHKRELMSVLPRSAKFYPNKVKAPDFTLGVDYAESDLGKAMTAYLAKSGNGTAGQQTPATGAVTKPESVKQEPVKTPDPVGIPAIDNFSDDIPFAPIGLQYPSILLSM